MPEPQQQPEPEPVISFTIGATVIVRGLRNKAEVNGRLAVVQGFDSKLGRYVVLIDGESKPAKLKPENLQLETEPEPEPEPMPDSLDMDVGAWLAAHGASRYEAAFREEEVATLKDVTVVIAAQSDLAELEVSEEDAAALWPSIARAAARVKGQTSAR